MGGLFPIHKQGKVNVCGQILDEDGIQPLEAMLFTLDQINRCDIRLFTSKEYLVKKSSIHYGVQKESDGKHSPFLKFIGDKGQKLNVLEILE